MDGFTCPGIGSFVAACGKLGFLWRFPPTQFFLDLCLCGGSPHLSVCCFHFIYSLSRLEKVGVPKNLTQAAIRSNASSSCTKKIHEMVKKATLCTDSTDLRECFAWIGFDLHHPEATLGRLGVRWMPRLVGRPGVSRFAVPLA